MACFLPRRNVPIQSSMHQVNVESYERQMCHAQDWMMRMLQRAAKLGATIVHDSIAFSGTPEECMRKTQLLFSDDEIFLKEKL